MASSISNGRLRLLGSWLARLREDVGLLVLLGALLSVLGGWAFIEIAGDVAEGDTAQLDEAALRALRSDERLEQPVGPAWLTAVARDITALGGASVLTLSTAIVAGYLVLSRRLRALVFLLTTTLGGTALSLLFKELYGRPRPAIVPHLVAVTTMSFPSGHAMLSATVYLVVVAVLAHLVPERRIKLYLVAVALLLTILVGLSRVYLGVHYPSDVLAGWVLGLSWGIFCWVVGRWLGLRQRARVRGRGTDTRRMTST